MATGVKSENDASVTSLVSGIINDAQELLKQQFQLFKQEVREDLRKSREAALVLGLGIALGLIGAILLALMLAHLLAWAAPQMPLWVCYGICGGVIFAIGLGLYVAGLAKFDSLNPLPKESARTLKENVQWITNPK
jgi:H+/Cl- antiporter ClcA